MFRFQVVLDFAVKTAGPFYIFLAHTLIWLVHLPRLLFPVGPSSIRSEAKTLMGPGVNFISLKQLNVYREGFFEGVKPLSRTSGLQGLILGYQLKYNRFVK
jgi:hypothetical protein